MLREWDQANDLLRYSSHTYLREWDQAADLLRYSSHTNLRELNLMPATPTSGGSMLLPY